MIPNSIPITGSTVMPPPSVPMPGPVAVLGLGHIGEFIFDQIKLRKMATVNGFDLSLGDDLSDLDHLTTIIRNHRVVIAATPYTLNKLIATICCSEGVAYMDLTEDTSIVPFIKGFPRIDAPMIPHCGLAPGFVNVMAYDMIQRFDDVRDVQIRVGALPRYPNNRMGYNLTWSTIGLINEYCNPVDVIENGVAVKRDALGDQETLVLDGTPYEAALTSGGMGTLAESLALENVPDPFVRNVNYKTIRYPGHFEFMRFLRDELGLESHKDQYVQIFDQNIARTDDDMVIILVKVTGTRQGVLCEDQYYQRILGAHDPASERYVLGWSDLKGPWRTAIQRATGFGVLAVLNEVLHDRVKPGLVYQEHLRASAIREFYENALTNTIPAATIYQ